METKEITTGMRIGGIGADVLSRTVAKIKSCIVVPFAMEVIRCEFIWRNPKASNHALERRMVQESAILLAKLTGEKEIKIRKLRSGLWYDGHYEFACQLNDLSDRMIEKDAPGEDIDNIYGMIFPYEYGHKSTISVNNLRYVHKMENIYVMED